MLKYDLVKNRRGQLSETLTWVVATIVIIFVLISSIYISSLMGKSKSLDKNKIFVSEEANWLREKNNYAFEVNSANKEKIDSWLKESDLNAG